jgi:heme/copper-type cytochrome/quinol oxidase subunit 3
MYNLLKNIKIAENSRTIHFYFFDIILGYVLTIIFAIIFLLLQIYEFYWANFFITDGVQGSIFYALTGLHGFHVFIGTYLIITSFVNFINRNCNLSITTQISQIPQLGFKFTYWYWQFVDIVWIFLFIFLYLPLA